MTSSLRLNYAVQQRRLECMMLILQWKGPTLQDGETEKVNLGAQDEVCEVMPLQWSLYFKTTHWTKRMWSYIAVVLK